MIIITGASDGLGLAVAQLYLEAGKTVVNISRTESKFANENILTDLSNGKSIDDAVRRIIDIDEKLEAIIQCAGVVSMQAMGSITEEEVDRLLATNVKSQLLLLSGLFERIKSDGTDIVNVSSTAGTKGRSGESVYGASKWAVRGLSASLQDEFKNLPNRMISFCPGGFKTKFFEKGTGIDNTGDGSEWMRVEDVAKFLKSILDLPKNMEVSEVIINRKAIK